MNTISTFIAKIIGFINDVLVPLVFAVAFIFFLYGVARYLIVGAANAESRKKAGEIILYSVIGFALMLSIWGIVNLVTNTFGFSSQGRPCLPTYGKDANCGGVSGGSNAKPATAEPIAPGDSGPTPLNPSTGLPAIY